MKIITEIDERVSKWLLDRWGMWAEYNGKTTYVQARAPYWWERVIGYIFTSGKEEKW